MLCKRIKMWCSKTRSPPVRATTLYLYLSTCSKWFFFSILSQPFSVTYCSGRCIDLISLKTLTKHKIASLQLHVHSFSWVFATFYKTHSMSKIGGKSLCDPKTVPSDKLQQLTLKKQGLDTGLPLSLSVCALTMWLFV